MAFTKMPQYSWKNRKSSCNLVRKMQTVRIEFLNENWRDFDKSTLETLQTFVARRRNKDGFEKMVSLYDCS